MSPIPNYTAHLSQHPTRFFRDFQTKLERPWVEKSLAEAERQFREAKSLPEWEAALMYWNELKCHIETHYESIQLAFQCYTEDAEIEAEEKRLREQVEPAYHEANGRIRPLLLQSAFRKALEEKFGTQYFLQIQLQQDSFDPANIDLDTQLNQVLADHTKLTGGADFEMDGQRFPLAHIKKFSNSPDAAVRKKAFEGYTGWFLNHEQELEMLFDRALGFRQKMAQNLGMPNYIPLAYQKMKRVDYGPEEVAVLRAQIHQVLVPIATKIRNWQAKSMGAERLSFCDTDYYPEWKLGDLKVGVDGQIAAAQKIYDSLSPTLGGHFKKMVGQKLIDLPSRSAKAPGAFCTGFSDFRVPFIFLNSVNAPSDVTTLLHETGHSFQAWESAAIDLSELRHPSLEACEVHSMGMEFLAHPYYEEFFQKEDAVRFRKLHLAESIFILPYIAMVDEFQHLVYSGQAEGPEGRARAWEALEDKYMPGIDFGSVQEWKRRRWIRQLHIFQVPFYYIDYAIAQIGAWQLWAQSIREPKAAMENYLMLCRLGGTKPLKEFFLAGRLRLPFEAGMLAELMDSILTIQPLP